MVFSGSDRQRGSGRERDSAGMRGASGEARKQGDGNAGKKDWWLDWTGQTVLIAASGPSQKEADLQAAKGRAKVVVINDTWRLAPWADVLYACDERWWQAHNPPFEGMKVIGKGEFPGCHCADVVVKSGFEWVKPHVNGGGNSGFQALNLVARWGANRIILTGYDFKDAGNHWFGKHPEGWVNPQESTMSHWRRCMVTAAAELKQRGFEVINATRDTALTCFPQMTIGDALERSR